MAVPRQGDFGHTTVVDRSCDFLVGWLKAVEFPIIVIRFIKRIDVIAIVVLIDGPLHDAIFVAVIILISRVHWDSEFAHPSNCDALERLVANGIRNHSSLPCIGCARVNRNG